ncbi:MAG TPA: tetratricopeptide repeat protein [Acetobacteraceae bacterium]|nr:tetratricopeptide repeat protein [Acetobacteraceae bacterium]
MTTSAESPSAPAIEDAARCYRERDYAGAEAIAQAIVAAEPRHFDALHLLGVLCINAKRPADAAGYLRRALAERPTNAEAQYHLGNAMLDLQLYDAAQVAFETALRLAPGHYDATNNLGNALAGAGRHEEAIERFREALLIRPHAAPTLYNLGQSLVALGRYDEAVAQYRAALDYAGDAPPDRLAGVVAGLCRAFVDQERYAEALAACRDVPPPLFGHPVIEWNESLTRLVLGDYRAGWRLYESRFLVPEHDPPRPGAQVLDLRTVAGRRVLVFGEQGRGDLIQFARYLPMLAARGAEVIAEIYPDLHRLFAGIDGVVQVVEPESPLPPCDLATPLLSLPLAFGTELDSVPATVPYLAPPPDLAQAWAARLGSAERPRIGLTWRGSSFSASRTSFPASALAPLVEIGGLAFHAVQTPLTASDEDWLARHPQIQVHAADLGDFADTAALLMHMDLVISVDTSVAHLAGALGRPTWVLLPVSPDWRWMARRADSPWYPTVRLFRQQRRGDWTELLRRVAVALAGLDFPAADSAGAQSRGWT